MEQTLIDRFGLAETQFLRRISRRSKFLTPFRQRRNRTANHKEPRRDRRLHLHSRAHLWRETNINAPVLPFRFQNFTQYLESRDFATGPGRRLAPDAGSNADVIRFDDGGNTSSTSGAIKVENGVRVLTLGVNASRSSNLSQRWNAIRF